MLTIKIAKNSGFCFGVRRAVDMTAKELESKGDGLIYSIGHIIHNRDVVKELSQKGLRVVEGLEGIENGTLIIRCHGLSDSVIEGAKNKGLRLVDTTCPYVMNSHRIANRLLSEGYHIIVVGDKDHPEIQALYDKGNVTIVDENTDLSLFYIKSKKVGLIAQTTLPYNFYKKVIRSLLKKDFGELRIFNTICNDTKKRQSYARRLARVVDCTLVVGGKTSANSRRLYQICKKANPNTYHIENSDELDESWFIKITTVGIVSGASTPDYIINQVVRKLKTINTSCKNKEEVIKF
ncbi:MAG: 4-hydroxy-3-methylbut-2-enyl diphosphate reductase [Candidatus Omnitrophica bacterium]|nr:4-hydroxy-3-methylbut-2-enyl diphosphate reductase [Candidatus Omnitrophota bacterium]